MKSIPFYKSKVFMTALVALVIQVLDTLSQSAVMERILAGDKSAIASLLAIVATAGSAFFRARSKDQPLTVVEEIPADAPKILAYLALVPMLSVMVGCASIRDNPASAQLVTQYAVAKYLEQKKTDEARYESAVRIVKIASDLRVVTGGTESRLDSLRVFVGGALAAQPLSPADRVLADGLVNLLLAELEARFKGGGVLSPEQVVVVNDLLSWVVAVAMTVPNPAVERPQ